MELNSKEMWALTSSPVLKIVWIIKQKKDVAALQSRWKNLLSIRDDGGELYKYCVQTRDPQLRVHICPVGLLVSIHKWHENRICSAFCMKFDEFEKLCMDDLTESFAKFSVS